MAEKKKNKDASAQDDDQLMLCNLLSQLESLEGDGVVLKHPGGIMGQEAATSSAVGEVETKGEDAGQVGGDDAEISKEEIMRELRHVKKQNFITHCLLSVMIVVTVAWQLSEVKLILKVRDGINHPFKAVGSMLTGMFKRSATNGQDDEDHCQIEPPSLSRLKMPELPHMEFPELETESDQGNKRANKRLNHLEIKREIGTLKLLKHLTLSDYIRFLRPEHANQKRIKNSNHRGKARGRQRHRRGW